MRPARTEGTWRYTLFNFAFLGASLLYDLAACAAAWLFLGSVELEEFHEARREGFKAAKAASARLDGDA